MLLARGPQLHRCSSQQGVNRVANVHVNSRSLIRAGVPLAGNLASSHTSSAVAARAARLAITAQASGSDSQASSGKVRRIILLRHAESEVTDKVRDHDRPISQVGKVQANSIAQKLKAEGWIPDLVLASNSKRTKQTLDEMAEVIDQLGEVRFLAATALKGFSALNADSETFELRDNRRCICFGLALCCYQCCQMVSYVLIITVYMP